MRVTLIDLWGREGMLHYVAQLGNHLARLPGMEVTVLLPNGSDVRLFEAAVKLGFVDVVKDASPRELVLAPLKLMKLPHFFRTVRRTRPDVIHLNNCHAWYLFSLPWLRQRYPVVATLHDISPHPGRDDTWRKRKEIDLLARRSHHIFVHGEALRAQLLARYPFRAAEEVTAIPLGDLTLLARYQTEALEEAHTVLFFGRIRAYKGLEYLIEAAQRVVRQIPDARFVIAGAGSLAPYRRSLAGETCFEVHNRYIPDEEVGTLFQRASLVVLPYVEASQSAVIPIAYAFGKPVVTTRVGCLPDIVDEGRTGLLVPPRDGNSLAEALITLLSDAGLRRAMGRSAHQKLEAELGWEGIVSTTLQVYRAAMQEREASAASPCPGKDGP
jgi:glycosyltransferase involved in cell wall biosynthesis